jgi:predicted Zn-dependent protease
MRKPFFYFLLVLTAVSGMYSCDRSGDFVIFSVQNDVELGAQVNEEILSNPDEYPILSQEEYPEAYQHLSTIMEQVLASDAILYEDVFAYDSIKIINNDEVLNAFATPGGYIYVYTGLIKYLDSSDHLAGVLGHEIAHAEQRHTSKTLQRQMGVQLLLDIVLGQNQGAVTQVLNQLGDLQFSRSAETEADEFSVTYLSNSASPYECTGAAGFFQKLQSENSGGGVPEFLSTHPNPDNRIEHIQETAAAINCETEPSESTILQKLKNSLPE